MKAQRRTHWADITAVQNYRQGAVDGPTKLTKLRFCQFSQFTHATPSKISLIGDRPRSPQDSSPKIRDPLRFPECGLLKANATV